MVKLVKTPNTAKFGRKLAYAIFSVVGRSSPVCINRYARNWDRMTSRRSDDYLTPKYKYRNASASSSSENTDEGNQRSVRKNGRFINPWPSAKLPTFGMLLKFLWFTKNNSRVPSQQELDQILPIIKPNFEEYASAPEHGIRVTWLGHASVLVQMDGINILTDPIFSARCSPLQFIGPKRYRDVPCTIHDLPPIHAVLISHTHYDHLDYNTVQMLNARFGSDIRWFVPMGLASWMQNIHCENVIELDWWDENCIPEHPELRFVFTPTQHWSKRTPVDDNKVLWGSWCVIGPTQRFYFAGDTGYCPIFEQIGTRYGPFDLAAIPIGSYEPRFDCQVEPVLKIISFKRLGVFGDLLSQYERWFLKMQHVDPGEAVHMHRDLRAKKSIGIHWGTFSLTYEFYREPPEKLREKLEEVGIPEDEFFVLKHGESRHLGTVEDITID